MSYIKLKWSVFFLAFAFAFWNCESDEDGTQKYGGGVFITNEGNFGYANGSVTFYDPDKKLALQAIYKAANGEFPGDVLQSLTLDGDNGYLVLNGSSKIEVINSKTFKNEGTITATEIVAPRYLSVINGKAYISVWGPYNETFSLIDSYVAVVDLKTNTVTRTIDTDEGVERLLYNGTNLFASNFNYGASSTVAVIDPVTNTRVTNIDVAPGPKGMVLDTNGKLWVICTGAEENDGVLYRINTATFEVEDEIELGITPGGDLSIMPDKATLVYNAGNDIYKISITAEDASAATSFTVTDAVYVYSIGVDPGNGDIYVADALAFNSAGKVYVYSTDGTAQTSFAAGIGPSGFVFR